MSKKWTVNEVHTWFTEVAQVLQSKCQEAGRFSVYALP